MNVFVTAVLGIQVSCSLLDNMARKTQTTFTRALGYAAVVSHALAETCSGAIFVWNLTLGRYFELTASFFFIYMVL